MSDVYLAEPRWPVSEVAATLESFARHFGIDLGRGFLVVADVERLTGIRGDTVRTHCQYNILRAQPINPLASRRTWMVSMEEVADWIAHVEPIGNAFARHSRKLAKAMTKAKGRRGGKVGRPRLRRLEGRAA